MVESDCFDMWWKTVLNCKYASIKHSTLFSQIYTQVIIATKCPPPHLPSILQPVQLPDAACFIALICRVELQSDFTAAAVYHPRDDCTLVVDRVIYILICQSL